MVQARRERHGSPAALAAFLGVALGAGCSLALDFDQPVDAPPVDAPVTTAECMAFEPNDDPAAPGALTAGTEVLAAICGNGESDYFRIMVDANQRITARITFMNRGGAGDLDLRLLSGDGAMAIDDSKTTADSEEVMCPGGTRCPAMPLAAGMYLVQVLGGAASVQSPYRLTYTQTAP